MLFFSIHYYDHLNWRCDKKIFFKENSGELIETV